VASTLFSGVAFGVGQGTQKRQSPDSPGPRNLGKQRHTYPAQATAFDEVRMAGSNRVAVDALGPDLLFVEPDRLTLIGPRKRVKPKPTLPLVKFAESPPSRRSVNNHLLVCLFAL
jgi:hypothetical protein